MRPLQSIVLPATTGYRQWKRAMEESMLPEEVKSVLSAYFESTAAAMMNTEWTAAWLAVHAGYNR